MNQGKGSILVGQPLTSLFGVGRNRKNGQKYFKYSKLIYPTTETSQQSLTCIKEMKQLHVSNSIKNKKRAWPNWTPGCLSNSFLRINPKEMLTCTIFYAKSSSMIQNLGLVPKKLSSILSSNKRFDDPYHLSPSFRLVYIAFLSYPFWYLILLPNKTICMHKCFWSLFTCVFVFAVTEVDISYLPLCIGCEPIAVFVNPIPKLVVGFSKSTMTTPPLCRGDGIPI